MRRPLPPSSSGLGEYRLVRRSRGGAAGGWLDFLRGTNAGYPEQVLQRDLGAITKRVAAMRRDTTPPERRLADNMLDYNPAATESLVQLMVNLNPSRARTVIVQGGAYGEHQLVSVMSGAKLTPIGSPYLTVRLDPGAGQRLVLTMKRHANAPTVMHPWHRRN